MPTEPRGEKTCRKPGDPLAAFGFRWGPLKRVVSSFPPAFKEIGEELGAAVVTPPHF